MRTTKKYKIKWENIIALLLTIFFIYSIIYHIQLNGLYIELIIELIIDITMILTIRYFIKDVKKNPENWKF